MNKKIEKALTIVAVLIVVIVMIDFFRFPECYVDGWKRDLKREIDAGNEEVIEFYNEHYVANGRILFE